jgi:hypothetical protein
VQVPQVGQTLEEQDALHDEPVVRLGAPPCNNPADGTLSRLPCPIRLFTAG